MSQFYSKESYPVHVGHEVHHVSARVSDAVVIRTRSGAFVAGVVETILEDGSPNVVPVNEHRDEDVSAPAYFFCASTTSLDYTMPENSWTFLPR